MNFERQLYEIYQVDPDQLHKNMNQDNLILLCQLADQSDNEITLQIVGSLVSTYIDQNHQNTPEFAKIFEFAWNRIKRFTTNSRPVYHFFASIIANIILHFYDQIPVQYFKEQAQIMNKQVYLIIIDTVLRRLQPQERVGEFRILDSKQKIVRQQFFKHNLDFFLEIITTSLIGNNSNPDLQLLDSAIDLLNLLLSSEIKEDIKEKDWHNIKRAEVKNKRNLQTIMREIKSQILDQNELEKMIQNQHLDHMDPITNHIKMVWSIVKYQQFIAKMTELLPLNIKIWESLGKICKIYQKYYSNDKDSIDIIFQITSKIMVSDISKINSINLLNFAGKTIFANHTPQWIEFNLNLIKNLNTIEAVQVGLKFLRNLVRFQRQYDYSQLHTFVMPIITSFFNSWIVQNNQWGNDKFLRNNIKHILKEISCFMIEQYLAFFAQMIQLNPEQSIKEMAFRYYSIGLFASIKCTTYQLDVTNKLQFYKMEQFLYPINLDLFKQFQYQEFYSKAFDFAFLYLNNQSPYTDRFLYKFWKVLFDQQTLIKFEEIVQKIQIDRKILFNFSRIFLFNDQDLIQKALRVFVNAKIKMEDQFYQINQINIPKECFSDFHEFRIIPNQKIITLYHKVKMYLLNVQNESIHDQLVSEQLIQKFKNDVLQFMDQIQITRDIVFILQSMLNENVRSLYGVIMQIIDDKGYLKLFAQAVDLDMLKLTRMMINTTGQIGQLKQVMVDQLYEWILLVVQKVQIHLDSINREFNQERQLGQKSIQNIYKLYYKPLLQLLKIFENLKYLNRLLTSKKQVRIQIYQSILLIFKYINLNDLSNYIHKMSSLFYVIQWLLEFEITRQMITDEIFGNILDFINCALLIQEKRSLMTCLKIISDIQTYDQFSHSQYIQQRLVAENCLFGAFLYNIRISDISVLTLRYFQRMPNDFTVLFSKLKQRMQPYKSQEWDQIINVKLDKLYSIIPKQQQLIKATASNKQIEKTFQEYFYQVQLFYNYYP
ncbi:unnamed protein product (macronuclear) [Paramecium tetraurelia]|uniref:Exportin-1 C-terminal domain-containing protein n=1 Tax=Paramecium tetraurelia TaxID=5888 RepID=A0BKY8_PARTE|nr:uncharacterized protein GSPATT00029836001 [Paramecium tetraurelia]CAK59205.1 unnamed protein product [Paramecium tetraurelia]|eukprot:XP_001426603.1 hypothetical protein (macronuclear) [Paramecium tetraurelia strain d4-2]